MNNLFGSPRLSYPGALRKAGSRVTLFWSLQPLENLDLTETLLVFLALEMLGITGTLASADFEKACGYSDTFLASAC